MLNAFHLRMAKDTLWKIFKNLCQHGMTAICWTRSIWEYPRTLSERYSRIYVSTAWLRYAERVPSENSQGHSLKDIPESMSARHDCDMLNAFHLRIAKDTLWKIFQNLCQHGMTAICWTRSIWEWLRTLSERYSRIYVSTAWLRYAERVPSENSQGHSLKDIPESMSARHDCDMLNAFHLRIAKDTIWKIFQNLCQHGMTAICWTRSIWE